MIERKKKEKERGRKDRDSREKIERESKKKGYLLATLKFQYMMVNLRVKINFLLCIFCYHLVQQQIKN